MSEYYPISTVDSDVRLRALEPTDLDLLYAWENDPAVWRVSGTLTPYSRHQLARYIEEQAFDLYQSRQQRLIICVGTEQRPVGCVDLFEVEPVHRRAGVGILIHDADDRGRGYATAALELLLAHARNTLALHQLWCDVEADNTASLALFRRAGFIEVGRRRDWLWSAEGYRDAIAMQRIL